MKRRIYSAVAIVAVVSLAWAAAAWLRAHGPQPPTTSPSAPSTPHVLVLGNNPPRGATPPPERTQSRTPVMDATSKLAMYDRLAKSDNPADNKLAYDLVQRCRDDRWAASRDPELTELAREECGDLVMRPGILEDPVFQLTLIERAAQAGVHKAYMEMYRNEYRQGRMGPLNEQTEARFEELRQIALSTADPYALAEESVRAQIAGDKPGELSLFVAYRTALAYDRHERYDPASDPPTQKLAAALPEATAKAAIAKGTQYVASAYKQHN